MTRVYRSDPLEIRVLAALAPGPSAVDDVAARVGEDASVVRDLLDQWVSQQAVTRLGLAAPATYSLTPRGLQAVGVYQGVQGAVDGAGHVDLAAATRLVMQQYEAAEDVATENAVREQAGLAADDAARDRVSAALNDAYARGALTKDDLDARTARTLSATTMGELRAAGDGVVELPPVPTGGPGPTGLPGPTMSVSRVSVSPALLQVRWRYAGYAAALVMAGLMMTAVLVVAGLGLLLGGLVLGGWALWPLLSSGTTRVNAR